MNSPLIDLAKSRSTTLSVYCSVLLPNSCRSCLKDSHSGGSWTEIGLWSSNVLQQQYCFMKVYQSIVIVIIKNDADSTRKSEYHHHTAH